MAILKNLANEIELHFTLLKSEEPQWLNYKIELYSFKERLREKLEDFSLTNHNSQFLDRKYDPEITNFIEGVRSVMDGAGFYSFSPADDRDFIIEICPQNTFIQLSYFVPKDYLDILYGIRIKVDETALNRFITELNEENERL